MAIEDDVTVVGGGLAGMTAALAAAREGAAVRVVSHKDSTLRSASGLVDVLGYDSDDELLADPFEAIPDLPERHPYRTVGAAGVREGFALFDDVVGDRYRGDHTDLNALVPTHGGTVKPTARYPASVAPGLASDDRPVLLVGFETVPDFDAPLAADHLRAAGVPFPVRGVTVRFPGGFRADAARTRLADALDADERVAVGDDAGPYSESLPIRRALAETAKDHLRGEKRVGFPALLGRHETEEVRADLEAELDAAVFEVPTGPPSLPGMRLEGALRGACREAGVRFTTGNPVVDFEIDGEADDSDPDSLAAVRVERNGAAIPFHADQFVLATGGLVGKGVDSDRERVREPIFDCYVPHPDDRYDWSADGAFGDHAFARFGVETDDDLRPLDRRGDPEFGNLRAAGAVLGGYDFAAEKSGSGVSLATGLAAGRRAAEEATR
ncbi:glycerol-3-phosphate dehydrogenase subunit GlpB [Halorussus rarus]|uniref:glycerol-3-phosphate dehydrogenase subunit GlpB n=1 Tax=Halorussus TaxID=1070314 RepID=UPI000E20C98D|nr:glycerol-3-phosphate dehydrogenase subunit GlpB [Halorussus rarus]NHN58901.1 glycerol-3-phosphate dehydrogenase subunit GlpB [Halorussus sp. JP-T4]